MATHDFTSTPTGPFTPGSIRPDEKQIPIELDRLQKNISILSESVDKLYSDLDCVMIDSINQIEPMQDNDKEQIEICVLANKIKHQSNIVNTISKKVSEILQNIQL